MFQAGFYEERNPLLMIRLPLKFQEDHPELTRNIKLNENRLATPYDLHITLRHILNLSVDKELPLEASGCKECKSLFEEITLERTCNDVHIPFDSCPCSMEKLRTDDAVVISAAQHTLDDINKKLYKRCEKLKLGNITSVIQQLADPWTISYIIQFNVTHSRAKFETYVRRKLSSLFSDKPQFELVQRTVHVNDNEAQSAPICIIKLMHRSSYSETCVNDPDL